MNTSESTNSVYRALCDAGVEHTVAHNACEQMLNLAGRTTTSIPALRLSRRTSPSSAKLSKRTSPI